MMISANVHELLSMSRYHTKLCINRYDNPANFAYFEYEKFEIQKSGMVFPGCKQNSLSLNSSPLTLELIGSECNKC